MPSPASAADADLQPSPWLPYRRHFERNATRALPPVPAVLEPRGLPGEAEAFARVLARFQLGEAGEGRVARQIHHVRLPGIDADYRRALELFVKEEGRHARILASMVRGLGGRLLSHAGSNRLFRWCRRLLGVRFKLLVLLVAEVVGGEMYATLARQARWPAVRAALDEMVEDEDEHLVFHLEFLRSQAQTWLARLSGRCALWLVGLGALTVVRLENARDLAALAIDRRALASRVVATLALADRAAFVARPGLTLTPARAVRS
jgi:hypothetical protein